MDYDDLVDQFIVNDPDRSEADEFVESENESESGESGDSKNKDNCENREKSENSIDLLSIHLKSLIHSRHLTLQSKKLEQIKDRNKKFDELKRREAVKLSELGKIVAGSNFGNNERRRRVLKVKPEEMLESGDKDTEDNVYNANTANTVDTVDNMEVDYEGDISNDNVNTVNTVNTSGTSDTVKLSTSSELIPCRLELDFEGYKLSDVFLLPSDPSPPSQSELEMISTQLCQEYDLPVDPFQAAIAKCLRDQVEEWHVYRGALEGMKVVPYEEIGPVPLRLDIIVGLHRLEDQLEVSLDPKDSNTETMRRFVDALRSPDPRILQESEYSAFKPLILHNLLEQLMLWRKAIVFGGFHRDPRSNNLKFHDGDAAVLLNDPPTASNSVRRHFAHTNTFTPILSVLTGEELEKIEAGRERESRRRRRTGPVAVTNTSSKKSNSNPGSSLVNNLTGTVRSPPRTLPTPTSYRGSLHRATLPGGNNSDEEGSTGGAPKKRGRKARY